jgi:hypothetical protein
MEGIMRVKPAESLDIDRVSARVWAPPFDAQLKVGSSYELFG